LWEELLIGEAEERKRVFENLEAYIKKIVEVTRKLDPRAEIYLFGSVAEGKHFLSSDVDVLVVTNTHPGRVLAELWLAGIKEPFEIHVITRSMLKTYERRSKLIRVGAELY